MFLVPVFVFSGCGDTPPPESTKYNLTINLNNVDGKDITLAEGETTEVEEGADATIKVAFAEGYRPDGMLASQNGAAITTGTLADSAGAEYSPSTTALATTVYWTYTIEDIAADTTIDIDVGACARGTINYYFDTEYVGTTHYAVLDEAPTVTITTAAELTEYLAANDATIHPVSSASVLVPYQSFVILFRENTSLILYQNDPTNDDNEDGYQIHSALYNAGTRQYFTYNHDGANCRVFAFVADKENLTNFTDIFVDYGEMHNTITNTFAIRTMIDGTDITQIANRGNIPNELIQKDEPRQPTDVRNQQRRDLL